MFDFAWSELALIGIVAMILIGPKDMPVAIKAVKEMIRKARAMAAEFQTHVDDMVRDTDLKEVRDSFNQIRNLDIKGELEKVVDGDGKIREAFADPLISEPSAQADGAAVEAQLGDLAAVTPVEVVPDPVPAFIPPQIAEPEEPPRFLPPNARRPEIRT
ncbi:MAG: twin-arginine translocase subunit TatB [Acetobacteraceae bacterium]|nr:twin-arginine translocase subunit TatB [Acetobacteraceae bacterium]